MWNYLLDCYNEGSLTFSEMEDILIDDRKAEELWEEFAFPSYEFVEHVRDEIRPFIKYMKDRELEKKV